MLWALQSSLGKLNVTFPNVITIAILFVSVILHVVERNSSFRVSYTTNKVLDWVMTNNLTRNGVKVWKKCLNLLHTIRSAHLVSGGPPVWLSCHGYRRISRDPTN